MGTNHQRDLLLLDRRGEEIEIVSAERAVVTIGEEIAVAAVTGDTDTVVREVIGSTAGLAQDPEARTGREDTGTGITRGQDREIQRRDPEAEIGRTGTGSVVKMRIAPGAVSATDETAGVERDHHTRRGGDNTAAESSFFRFFGSQEISNGSECSIQHVLL